MPWKVSGVVEKRKQFLAEYASGERTMRELCGMYGISRPTGYAVLRRFQEQGETGLQERSRAALRHPNQTAAEIEEAVLELRREHMTLGTAQAEVGAGAGVSASGVAGGEHDRSAAGPGRSDAASQKTAQGGAV